MNKFQTHDTHIDIQKLASLAKICIPQKEIQKLKAEIGEIIAFADTLDKYCADHVEICTDIHYSTLRNDTPEACLKVDDILKNAPESNENYIRVPKVI